MVRSLLWATWTLLLCILRTVQGQSVGRTIVYQAGASGGSSTDIDPAIGMMFVGKDTSHRVYAINLTTGVMAGAKMPTQSGGICHIDSLGGGVAVSFNMVVYYAKYQVLAGVLSFFPSNSASNALIPYSQTRISGTSYFMIGTSSYVYKYDGNNLGGGIQQDSGFLVASGNIRYTREVNANYVVVDSFGARAHLINKVTCNDNDYIYPSVKTDVKALTTDPATGRLWHIVARFLSATKLYAYNCGTGSNCNGYEDTNFDADDMTFLPNLNLLIISDGSNIIIKHGTSLNTVGQSPSQANPGGINDPSFSHYFFYEPVNAGGFMFGYISGGNYVAGVIRPPCGVANCFSCGIDPPTQCENCISTPNQYFLKNTPSPHACYLYGSIPSGQGIDILSTQIDLLKPCMDTNCNNCRDDYTKCVYCNPTWYVWDYRCYQKPSFNETQGVNTTTNWIETCLDPGCLNCKDDKTVCVACKSGFYVYGTICLDKPSFPLGYGINTVTQYVEACAVTNCYYCTDDKTVCTCCRPGFFLYMNGCYDKPNFPAQHGISGINIVPCTDPNCDDCKDTYSVCTTCQTNWYKYQGGCLDKPSFSPTQGVNTTTNSVEVCLVSNCINCKDDITICVECGPLGTNYLFNNTCITTALFPPRIGIDPTNKLGVPCSDPNCQACVMDYSDCTNCDINWYLYPNSPSGCIDRPSFPPTHGIDLVTLKVVPCAPAGCLKCIEDHSTCECNNTAGLYWYNNDCILKVNFPAIHGVDPVTKKVVPCTDPNCESCVDNINYCISCNYTTTKPYDFNGACVDKTQIPDTYGVNLANNSVIKCQSDSNCLQCLDDASICTRCNQNSINPFLYNNICLQNHQIPLGFGPGPYKVVSTCEVQNCSLCLTNKTTCTACFEGYYILPEQNQCLRFLDIPDYYGIIDNKIIPCNDNTCVDCKSNAFNCIVYHQLLYDYVYDSKSISYDTMYVIRIKKELDNSRLAAGYIEERDFINRVNQLLLTNNSVRLYGKSDGKYVLDTTTTAVTTLYSAREPTIVVKVKLENRKHREYLVEFLTNEIQFFYIGERIGVRAFSTGNKSIQFEEPDSNGVVMPQQELFLNPLKLIPVSPNSRAELGNVGAAGAAVADGGMLIIKFGQFIKLLTKIQFINANFGTKLRAFLEQTTDMFRPPFLGDDTKVEVYTSVGYRARISKAKISLSFSRILFDKITLYLISWIVRVYCNFMFMLRGRPGKPLLLIMYYWPKLHMILLNLLFLDFLFYGNRSMSHIRVGEYLDKYLSSLVISLVALDMFLLAILICDDERWASRYYDKRQEKKALGLIEEVNKSKSEVKENQNSTPKLSKRDNPDDSTFAALKDSPNDDKSKVESKSPRLASTSRTDRAAIYLDKEFQDNPEEGYEYEIDYERVFKMIDANHHMIDMIDSNLSLTAKVYSSKLARSHILVGLLRFAVYQIFITCGQYVTGLLISILLSAELAKLIYVVLTYIRCRHLASVISFIAEVMQSIFLAVFLAITFILQFYPLTSDMHLELQNIGIWLIISAIAVEYLLLLINSLVALTKFIKERKIKKTYELLIKDKKKKREEGMTKLEKILEEKSKGPLPVCLYDPKKISDFELKDQIEREEWYMYKKKNKPMFDETLEDESLLLKQNSVGSDEYQKTQIKEKSTKSLLESSSKVQPIRKKRVVFTGGFDKSEDSPPDIKTPVNVPSIEASPSSKSPKPIKKSSKIRVDGPIVINPGSRPMTINVRRPNNSKSVLKKTLHSNIPPGSIIYNMAMQANQSSPLPQNGLMSPEKQTPGDLQLPATNLNMNLANRFKVYQFPRVIQELSANKQKSADKSNI